MSDKLTKIYTVAHVTPSLENEWLQHLRDFDTAHPGCHFEVLADTPDLPFHEIIEMLPLDPGLSLWSILTRKKPS